jgi:pimeloyl-ACP methyl ester carboxylesterase
VLESATDVLALADRLDWHRFAIVGHSMSTLVALHLMQHHAQRVTRAVLLTPAPPASFRANDAALEGARALALGDDQMRLTSLTQRFGHRYSMGWTALKAERWRATADPDAAARYAAMFMQGGVPEPTARVTGPVLAVTGAHDAPWMRRDAVERDLSPICDQLQIDTIADSGHYPMQETPPLTVSLTERFLLADGEPTTARGDGSL